MCGLCGHPCDCDSLWHDPDVMGVSPEEEDALFTRRAPGSSPRRSASGPGGSAYSRSSRRQGLSHPLIASRTPAGSVTRLAPFTASSAPLPIPAPLIERPFEPEPSFPDNPTLLPPGLGERDFA